MHFVGYLFILIGFIFIFRIRLMLVGKKALFNDPAMREKHKTLIEEIESSPNKRINMDMIIDQFLYKQLFLAIICFIISYILLK
jgi:hypothetical protein